MGEVMSDNDDKKVAHCPGCGRKHMTTFTKMHVAWRAMIEAADHPMVIGIIMSEAVEALFRDRSSNLTAAFSLLKHAALSEFYYNILRTDLGDLPLTQTERDQLETLLEDFHSKGMNLADSLEHARQLALGEDEGKTLEQVFAEEEKEEGVLDVLRKYGLLGVKAGDA
jgi:hypothetical protein